MRIESRNSVQTRFGERYTPDGDSELIVLVFEQDVGWMIADFRFWSLKTGKSLGISTNTFKEVLFASSITSALR
jgi:hypothetical protein